jgi:hypothetical protein
MWENHWVGRSPPPRAKHGQAEGLFRNKVLQSREFNNQKIEEFTLPPIDSWWIPCGIYRVHMPENTEPTYPLT